LGWSELHSAVAGPIIIIIEGPIVDSGRSIAGLIGTLMHLHLLWDNYGCSHCTAVLA
jgi:hypothetical protein